MGVWWGWIANISENVFLLDRDRIIKRVNQKKEVERIADASYELSGNKHIWTVKVRIGEGNIEIEAKCKVEREGMCEIELGSERLDKNQEKDIANRIYRFIRDIYHVHIHHPGDQPLSVVEAQDKCGAIKEILKQYLLKFIIYQETVRSLINEKNMNNLISASERAASGKGEVKYALAFISSYGKNCNLDRKYHRVFKRFLQSLSILEQHINTKSSFYNHFKTRALQGFGISLACLFGVYELVKPISPSIETSLIVSLIEFIAIGLFIYLNFVRD